MKTKIFSLLLLSSFLSSFSQQDSLKINQSLIAFTVSEKDLLPENIAYDSKTESFFIGSTRKGKIIMRSKEGKETDFASGLYMVIGMKVDVENRWLWVCSSGGGNLVGYELKDDKDGRPAGIFKFDLDSGEMIKKYEISTPGEVHFFNDLVIDKLGNAYATHMFSDAGIYKISKEKDELELFVKPTGLRYPNGIAISNDNSYLFVAHADGITRVDINSKESISLKNEEHLKISGKESIDGIYFKDNSLIGIQPDINTVQKFILNDNLDQIVGSKLLEVNHPMMNNPTTGVMINDMFFYISNAQFGSFDKDGKLFPMEQLYEPTILKIKIGTSF
nr:SMP-30/gluconolactonase/LRE family protein [uncultured Psychroserpens sp.]